MKYFFNQYLKLIILTLIGLSIPYIEFINKNLAQIDYVIIKDTSKIYLGSILLLIVLYFVLKSLFRNRYDFVIIFSFFQYFFFKFNVLKDFFVKTQIPYDGEISLIIIVSIFFFIFQLRKKTLIIKFLSFYIVF